MGKGNDLKDLGKLVADKNLSSDEIASYEELQTLLKSTDKEEKINLFTRFVLVNKTVSFTEINEIDHTNNKLIVYKDKNMTISVDDDNFIYISSKWFGPIKDSFFTINNTKHKGPKRHGAIHLVELKKWHKNHTQKTQIQKHNKLVVNSNGTPFSQLNELCQKRGWPQPTVTHEQKGSSHNPTFIATIVIEGKYEGNGTGKGKKAANNDAAEKALVKLNV